MNKYFIITLLFSIHSLHAADPNPEYRAPSPYRELFADILAASTCEVEPEISPLDGDPVAKVLRNMVLGNTTEENIIKLLGEYTLEWQQKLILAANLPITPLAVALAKHNNFPVLKLLAEILPEGKKRDNFLLAYDAFDEDTTALYYAMVHDNNDMLSYIQETTDKHSFDDWAIYYNYSSEKHRAEHPDAAIYEPLTAEEQERQEKNLADLEAAAAPKPRRRRARTLSGHVSNLKF
jgi:hypothetical protein